MHLIFSQSPPIAMLGDDAFEAHFASALQQHRAVGLDFLGKTNCAFPALDQILEHLPALVERQAADVVAVKIEQIEGIEDRLAGVPIAAAAERLLERWAIRAARLVEHDGLAVQDIMVLTSICFAASAMAGKRWVQSCPLRVRIRTPLAEPRPGSRPFSPQMPDLHLWAAWRRQAGLDPLRHRIEWESRLVPASGLARRFPEGGVLRAGASAASVVWHATIAAETR
jgi:hypothetical protein